MRISDWSSDVCSSDLRARRRDHEPEGNGMNAANQDGRRRSRVDAKVVELAAYRAGPGEPYARVGTQADVAGAVALAKSRHEASRLGGLPWNAPKSAALFSSAVSADDRLLLIAVPEGEIVGSFLGMQIGRAHV